MRDSSGSAMQRQQTVRAVGAGAGGHARVVAEALGNAGRVEIVAFTDPDRALHGRTLCGAPVVGTDDELARLLSEGVSAAFIGLGGTGNNRPRAELFKRVQDLGFELLSAFHRTAVISGSAHLGTGVIVLAGGVINAGAMIGDDVI